MPKPVLTKADFVVRYKNGEFGNASPTWDTFEEYMDSGYRGLVHYRNRVAGGKTWYNIPYETCFADWIKACLEVPRCQLYISAMAPTDKTLIQGEVMRGVWGLDLTYTFVKKPMRDAFAEQTLHANKLQAIVILRQSMDNNSFEWLQYLLDNYEDHVIEFSVYDVEWGTVEGYNTVFWECRKY